MSKREFKLPAVMLSYSKSSELRFRERRTIAFRSFTEFMPRAPERHPFRVIQPDWPTPPTATL
jgi:hypothetical protein